MDVLSRLMWAPQIDLGIAVGSTAIAFTLGAPIGALAGYFGGRGGIAGLLSAAAMRVMDVSLSFPVFIFALGLVGVLGPATTNVVIALAFVNTPVFVWLTRSAVLTRKESMFVDAARCSGNSELQIVFRHLVPNSLTPALTQISIVLGFGVLLTAGLSFVGAGVRDPTPEWGAMISLGSSSLVQGDWWPALFPGLALGSAVLGFSLLGDGLKAYLDPKQRSAWSGAIERAIEMP
jgi:peptide/nickel transport system permease protein